MRTGCAARWRWVHRRYAGIVHARRKRTGHFWRGRFGCVVMDEEYLAAALRYVSLNPVRARLVSRARDWRWSRVRAQLGGRHDSVTAVAPVRERYPDFAHFLSEEDDAEIIVRLRAAGSIGRPLGNPKFLDAIERKTRRVLKPAKRGPKPQD
jgi:putative transposase